MSDFAAIFDVTASTDNNQIGQIQVINLPFFAAEANKFEHEFKKGGLLDGFFRKENENRIIEQPIFERYRQPMMTMLALCARGDFHEENDWCAAVTVMLRMNKGYFLRDRNTGNQQGDWFGTVQLLLANGHQLSDIHRYTFDAFIGFSKAAAKLELDRQKRQALAVRFGYGAEHKVFKNWIEGV